MDRRQYTQPADARLASPWHWCGLLLNARGFMAA
jgi:hypothetical protein